MCYNPHAVAGTERGLTWTQNELLRGPELYNREREAWKNDVLSIEVNVPPLPDFVTPEVQSKLIEFGFGDLIYVPRLNLKSLSYLRSVGVDSHLEELEGEYPKWRRLESLSFEEKRNHAIARNLG